MAFLPINLIGSTLSQRHRYLNALVDEAFTGNVNFQEILVSKEQSPVDRLFKIDLASKLKDVDYIIKTLKDDDMLFVSRALKCKWLLENDYQHIINPEYLDKNLYPHMITTAVNKMKCWISVYLKEPNRCQEFYEYYREKDFDLAIRYLSHCSVSYMLHELTNLLDKLTPFYFKVLCEKSPQVAKMFYDSFERNEKVLNMYLNNETQYYACLKIVLKSDSNIYLDITEKFYNRYKFERLSSTATRFIMFNCRDRFIKKSELYTSWLLDMKTMAQCLTSEECKELVLKLARAEYLENWFSYKNVEPLIKRLDVAERPIFKKKVFVEKDIGRVVKEWPYETPDSPTTDMDTNLFGDFVRRDSYEDESGYSGCFKKMKIRKKGGGGFQYCDMICVSKERSLLDQLFNEFRFMSFEKTLFELRKRICAESSQKNRQYMMLVLVSKTGGRHESVANLLQLLAEHENEPSHVRATIIRSLVKRAFVWRLPQESWECLITFSRGLGLDGGIPEAECREGLHAVVLRNLLSSGCIEPPILSAFIREFSTLKEYSLTPTEQKAVTELLPAVLLAAIVGEKDTNKQAELFNLLFETLDDFRLPIDTCPVVPALAALANIDFSAASDLIIHLYKTKKARRELFIQNFECISTDESYLNALRHNTEVLKNDKFVKRILDSNVSKKRFIRKLAIYFTENNGLADIYLSVVKESLLRDRNLKENLEIDTEVSKSSSGIDLKLVRYFALLIRTKLEYHLRQLNRYKHKDAKRFAATLRANVHLCRPMLDINAFGWQAVGAKAVANRLSVCREVDINSNLPTLLKWRKTLKLAISLSIRTKTEVGTFTAVSKMRPNVALKCAIKYFHHGLGSFNQDVWEIVKPIMKEFDYNKKSNSHISRSLYKFNKIPECILSDYYIMFYTITKKNDASLRVAQTTLKRIEDCLPKINKNFLEDLISKFLQENFTVEQIQKQNINETSVYLRILVKFLLLSKSEEIQKKQFEKYGELILENLKSIYQSDENRSRFAYYFSVFTTSLRYNHVFFNTEYVSCLYVFEKVVEWMHSIFPIDSCFKYYVEVHLTMLFFKSVRACLKQKPGAFNKDDINEYKKSVDILGQIFGTYIGIEVNELKERYYESIIELYANVLGKYFDEYFEYDPLKRTFVINVIKGIFEHGEGTTLMLGLHMCQDINYDLRDTDAAKELLEILREKGDPETQFLMQMTFE